MKYILTLILLLNCSQVALAEDFSIKGFLKSTTSIDSYESSSIMDIAGDETAMKEETVIGRIMVKSRPGEDVYLNVHYENSFSKGEYLSAVEALKGRTAHYDILKREYPKDSAQLFSLSQEYTDENDEEAYHRLDRLYAEYKSQDYNIRFGRQAYYLGHGKVFNPADIIAPFSPLDVFRDYKSGSDMLLTQVNTDELGVVQALAVPRREISTGDIKYEESTGLLVVKKRKDDRDFFASIGGHYGDVMLSGGYMHELRFADISVDGSYAQGVYRDYYSALINAVYDEDNAGGYIEFYYNSIGVSDFYQIAGNTELSERVNREELFLRDKLYSSFGGHYQPFKKLRVDASAVLNIIDRSFAIQPRGTYQLRKNIVVIAGFDLPEGGVGTEFGGFEGRISGRTIAPAKRVYAQVTMTF